MNSGSDKPKSTAGNGAPQLEGLSVILEMMVIEEDVRKQEITSKNDKVRALSEFLMFLPGKILELMIKRIVCKH